MRVRESGWMRLGPDSCIHSSIARLHVCRISFVSVLYLLSFLCLPLSAFMGCGGFHGHWLVGHSVIQPFVFGVRLGNQPTWRAGGAGGRWIDA